MNTEAPLQAITVTAELDEEGCDGEGEYWDSEWEYKCNYKLAPVAAPKPTEDADK